MTVAVITIVRDRAVHLGNVVRGLAGSSRPPDETIVVVMGGEHPAPAVPRTDLPVIYLDLATDPDRLPLSEARNAGAELASSEHLIFLDVDCVPGRGAVAHYEDALCAEDRLLMGAVRYLAPAATAGRWAEATLRSRSQPHPSRPVPMGGGPVPTDAYELFWSLSFGVRRDTFRDTIGGFDPCLDGYGGEDTDLAFSARAAGVRLAWLPSAVAYHQHHETYDPPLQHVRSIVRNARTFHAKWGVWPMEGWLVAMDDLGIIRFDPTTDRLDLLRMPTPDERASARRPRRRG